MTEFEKRQSWWDVVKTKSVWNDDRMEFEHHLFQLLTRIVCADYARHFNVRREFSPDIANTPYVFTHVVTAADTLSETFGNLGIVNGFFIKMGIIQGENHLGDLC